MSIWKKIHENKEARAWPGEMPVYYLYTPGPAGEKFFTTIKEKGKLLASKCPECGHVYLPPRVYCEKCIEDIEEFFEVPAEGNVVSWTVVWKDSYGNPLDKPEILAFINITGTDGGIIHRILTTSQKDLKGRRVKAKFKPKKDRAGSLNDIEGFEVVE